MRGAVTGQDRFAAFTVALVGAALGCLAFFAWNVPVETFFAPWQHDDFLWTRHLPSYVVYRPVSILAMHGLGVLGWGIYYATYTAIWTINIGLVVLILERLLFADDDQSYLRVFCVALFVSSCWFLTTPSVLAMQYLGLMTNAVSQLFGLLAALVAIAGRHSLGRVMLFGLLVFLSAFAKEDMAGFLLILAAWVTFKNGRGSASLVAIVVAAYVLSVLYSLLVGSVIMSGSGGYNMGGVVSNVVSNMSRYFMASPGTSLTFGAASVIAVAVAIRVRREQDALMKVLLVASLGAALIAPYLILPRYFAYYLVGIIPFVAAAGVMLFLRFVTARSIMVPALGAASVLAVWGADTSSRAGAFDWVQGHREQSRRQIIELQRAADVGLTECAEILVSGVDASVGGPFVNNNPGPLDHVVGRELNWAIVAPAGSRLAEFSGKFRVASPRLRFVAEGSEAEGADCMLAYDPQSQRADLTTGR